jgi:hypothetical protein
VLAGCGTASESSERPTAEAVAEAFSLGGQMCVIDANSDGSSRGESRDDQLAILQTERDDASGSGAEFISRVIDDVSDAPADSTIELWQCGDPSTGEPTAFFYASTDADTSAVSGVYLAPAAVATGEVEALGARITPVPDETWDELTSGG